MNAATNTTRPASAEVSTPEDLSNEDFVSDGFITEQSVKVYLQWERDQERWVVAPSAVDGYPLDGLDTATNDYLAADHTPEMLAEITTANTHPLPNADQTVLLLLEALPAESTVKDALTTVLTAAQRWATHAQATDIGTEVSPAMVKTIRAAAHLLDN